MHVGGHNAQHGMVVCSNSRGLRLSRTCTGEHTDLREATVSQHRVSAGNDAHCSSVEPLSQVMSGSVQALFRESSYRSAGQSLVQKARTQTCAPKSRVRGRHPQGDASAVPCLPNHVARQSEEQRKPTQQQRWSQGHSETMVREATAGPGKPATPPKSLVITTLSPGELTRARAAEPAAGWKKCWDCRHSLGGARMAAPRNTTWTIMMSVLFAGDWPRLAHSASNGRSAAGGAA